MVPSVYKVFSSTVECILSDTVSEIKYPSNDSDIIQPPPPPHFSKCQC